MKHHVTRWAAAGLVVALTSAAIFCPPSSILGLIGMITGLAFVGAMFWAAARKVPFVEVR